MAAGCTISQQGKLIHPSMIVIAYQGEVLNYYDAMHESLRGHHQADGSIPQYRSP
jgi:hypothetical protein